MSYAPYLRNTSGVVFFGRQGNEEVFYSDSNFIVDRGPEGSLRVPNLRISNGGTLGSATTPGALTVATNGDISLSQSLSIAGNLTVNGTTTTVNSTVVTIEDPVIILGSNASGLYGSPADDNKDRGVAFSWNTGSGPSVGFFGHDDSIGGFTYIPSGSLTSDVMSGSPGWAVFNGVSGNLVGNASTTTTLLNSRDFSITGNTTATAVSFNGSNDVVLTSILHPTAISDRTAITTVDGTNDFLLIWDATDSALKRVNRANFVSGLGTMSSFNISDGTNTQAITEGNTLLFRNGAAINFTVSATDSVSGTLNSAVAGTGLSMTNQVINVGAGNGISVAATTVAVNAGSGLVALSDGLHLKIEEYSAIALASGDSFLVLDSNGATHQRATVSQLGTYLGGTNIVVGGDGKLNVPDNLIGGSVFNPSNFVDSATIDFTVTSGVSVTAIVINDSIDNTKIRNSAGMSVIGRSADTTGDPADIVAASDFQVLRRTGTAIAFGAINLASSVAVTGRLPFSNVTQGSALSVLGVTGNATADVASIAAGTDHHVLRRSGTALGFGLLVNNNVDAAAAINFSKLENGSATSVLGRSANSVGAVASITTATDGHVLRRASAALSWGLLVNANIDAAAAVEFSKLENGTALSVLGRSANSNGALASIAAAADGDVLRRSGTTVGFGQIVAGGIADGSVTEAKRLRTVATVSTTSTLSSDINLCNAASAAITVTLPAVSSGRIIRIKKSDSSGNTVTIQRGGTSTIDGATTKILYSQYESMTIACDGTNWFIV
jgi:hypothetical protein